MNSSLQDQRKETINLYGINNMTEILESQFKNIPGPEKEGSLVQVDKRSAEENELAVHKGRRRFFSDPESCQEFFNSENLEIEEELVKEYSESDLDSVGSSGTIQLKERKHIGGSDSYLQLNFVSRIPGAESKCDSSRKRHSSRLERRVSTIAALGKRFSFQLLRARDNMRSKSEIQRPRPSFKTYATSDLPVIREESIREKNKARASGEPVHENPSTETEASVRAQVSKDKTRYENGKSMKERFVTNLISSRREIPSYNELKHRDDPFMVSTPLERKLGYAGVAPFFGTALADKLTSKLRSKSFTKGTENGFYPYSESRAKSFSKEFLLERPDGYIENLIDDCDSYYAYKEKQNRTKSFRFSNEKLPSGLNKLRSRSMIIKSKSLLEEPNLLHRYRNNTTNDNIRRKNPHAVIA